MCCVLLSHTPQEEWRGEIEQLSWKPRAFLAKGFLSDEEADHIINTVRVPPLCRDEGWVGWGVRWGGATGGGESRWQVAEIPACCF